MPTLSRLLVGAGLVLLVLGLAVMVLNRLHLPLGRLPGDFKWRGRNWTVSFPLGTSLLLSVLLSLLVWGLGRFRR